jgi:staphylococcal nuclease domain-containing protein 1
MDRGGNFIGRLTTSDGQSAALMLVQAGLAKVHDSAYNAPDYKQLLEAQEKCRKDRTGVWTNYEEPVEKENEEENHPEGRLNPILFIYINNFVFYCRGNCERTRSH